MRQKSSPTDEYWKVVHHDERSKKRIDCRLVPARRPNFADSQECGMRLPRCELYLDATQTVFGQGPGKATIMLVGEQPGDEEDRRGEPFVGPAGNVLDRALKDAGLDRRSLYLTNAVKHFRFVVEGKRRKHQAPRPSHIRACRPWLEAEIHSIDPHVVVCLGATAARSLLEQRFRLTKERGKVLKTRWAPHLLATFHPSAVLRGIDAKSRETMYESLVHDLKMVADLL